MTAENKKEFFVGYLTTALWSSTDDNGESLDNNYCIGDIEQSSRDEMKGDCDQWIGDNAALLSVAIEATGNTWKRAGHDYWLTRNGHGAGFWDGAWGQFGDDLTHASKTDGTCDLYVTDSGKISHHY